MKNITINISLPEPLLDAVDKHAETELRNRSELIREAIRNYLLDRQNSNPVDTFSDNEHKRYDSFIKELDSQRKWLVLSLSFRPQPNTLRDIFRGELSEVTRLIEKPGGFRAYGWDLETLDKARPIAGEFLQVKNGIRKVMRVYKDGQVLFAGDEEFIGFNVNNDPDDACFSINALAATEVMANFVRFGHEISNYMNDSVSKMILKLSFLNQKKEDVRLTQAVGVLFPENSETSIIGTQSPEVSIILNKEFSLEKAAYSFIAELFYLFGLREDEFWFVDKKRRMLDLSNFRDRR